jgi:hypothetical protein
VHREQHVGGVYLGHDAEQVGGAPCVAPEQCIIGCSSIPNLSRQLLSTRSWFRIISSLYSSLAE